MFGNSTAVNSGAAEMRESAEPQEPKKELLMLKRIGSTTYEVSIRFSENNVESLEDKILRMALREVTDVA